MKMSTIGQSLYDSGQGNSLNHTGLAFQFRLLAPQTFHRIHQGGFNRLNANG